MTRPAREGRRSGFHVWKRWCSVCGERFAHVYPDGCERIECKCGAVLAVPELSVIEGGKS